MMPNYSFYKSVILSSLLLIHTHFPLQAMVNDEENDNLRGGASSFKKKVITEKEKKRRMMRSYNQGMKNLFLEDYSSAFRNFLYVASQGCYSVDDFNSPQNNGYFSSLFSSFGYHPTEPKELDQWRFGAFGYVYTLWQTNKNGLNKESAIGKAMGTCLDHTEERRLVEMECTQKIRAQLLEKSKDWVLTEGLKEKFLKAFQGN